MPEPDHRCWNLAYDWIEGPNGNDPPIRDLNSLARAIETAITNWCKAHDYGTTHDTELPELDI